MWPACAIAAALIAASPPNPTWTDQSPGQILAALRNGNARFVAGECTHPNTGFNRIKDTGTHGQQPAVTIMGCSDSRVPIELVFDQGIGDVFTIRVAGNVSDTDEIGSIEYGVGHLNTPLMVVLGHTKCGAVTAVATGAQVHGSIPGLVDNIIPAVQAAREAHPNLSAQELVPFAVEENVMLSIRDLLTNSEEVRSRVADGRTQVVGAVYDIDTGKVKWLGQHPQQAVLISDSPATHQEANANSTH